MPNKKFKDLDKRLDEAVKKHPKFADDERHAVSLISEELGELSAEINDQSPGWRERAVMEAHHVAVTALRTVHMLTGESRKSTISGKCSDGDWGYYRDSDTGGFHIYHTRDGLKYWLAWIGDTTARPVEENEANAKMMAGSKDLAEVLAEAVSMYGKPGGPWNVPGDPGSWLYRARKALEKAGVENATT